MGTIDGAQQIGTDMAGIALGSIAKYKWAGAMLRKRINYESTIVDLGCGCGFGPKILGDTVRKIYGYDNSSGAAKYAKYFAHKNVTFRQASVFEAFHDQYAAAVMIDSLESIDSITDLIAGLKRITKIVVATVPNELVSPFDPEKNIHRLRHFTKDSIIELFDGWDVSDWHSQTGKHENCDMVPGVSGGYLGFVAEMT